MKEAVLLMLTFIISAVAVLHLEQYKEGSCSPNQKFSIEVERCITLDMRPVPYMCLLDGERICFRWASVCDGFIDCPLGEDERPEICPNDELLPCSNDTIRCGNTKICHRNDTTCRGEAKCPGGYDRRTTCGGTYPTPSCLYAQFACDGVCKPNYQLCNGIADCFDGVDEGPITCNGREQQYQVSWIGVGINDTDYTFINVTWAMPPINSIQQPEFRPALCEVFNSSACSKAQKSTKRYNYNSPDWETPNFLRPSTKYNISVEVSIGNVVYPPGVFYLFYNGESEPQAPHSLSVSRKPRIISIGTVGERLKISWQRPELNGRLLYYTLYCDPPLAHLSGGNESRWTKEEAHVPLFGFSDERTMIPGRAYNFSVDVLTLHSRSRRSENLTYVFSTDVATVWDISVSADSKQTVVTWTTGAGKVDEFQGYLTLVDSMYRIIYKGICILEQQGGLCSSFLFPAIQLNQAYQVEVQSIYLDYPGIVKREFYVGTGNELRAVTGLSTDMVTSSTVTVYWDPVELAVLQGSGITYGVYVWGKVVETSNIQISEPFITNRTVFEVKNLLPCQEYMIDVGIYIIHNSKNPILAGQLTEKPKTITTKPKDCAPPKNVRASYDKRYPPQATVSWDPPCDVSARGIDYEILVEYNDTQRTNRSYNFLNENQTPYKFLMKDVPLMLGINCSIQIRVGSNGELSPPINIKGPQPQQPQTRQIDSVLNTIFTKINVIDWFTAL